MTTTEVDEKQHRKPNRFIHGGWVKLNNGQQWCISSLPLAKGPTDELVQLLTQNMESSRKLTRAGQMVESYQARANVLLKAIRDGNEVDDSALEGVFDKLDEYSKVSESELVSRIDMLRRICYLALSFNYDVSEEEAATLFDLGHADFVIEAIQGIYGLGGIVRDDNASAAKEPDDITPDHAANGGGVDSGDPSSKSD